MAKIPLRAYTKEIDGLIDRGQYEQALAHSRYILKLIPKHIDTYRLMAKAYLESQRYSDASDVFQRVLSAIPDDFVSQLGMSIIREDEGNVDAAIWHMERAFEIQPANGAIQSELRRLYGRRDGIEPPKIRLTRGALARMYYKGELYPQAINELRAALAADPQRPDLQLLLAKSYERAGHRAEAVTACNTVLSKLPYCIEANRIQAEILEHTGRAEDARVYRQRAVAMNPYLGQTNPRAPTPEQVPDEAVVIERLDWMPDKGVASQPRWAASLGVDIGPQPASQEDVPDWLQVLESSPQTASSEPSSDVIKVSPFVSEPEELKSDGEVIPDWMKEAGWEPSSEETAQAERGYTFGEEVDEEEEEEGLAPAEIPSWLRGLAPEEAFTADQSTGLEPDEIDQKLIEALDSAAIPWLEETPPGAGDTISGWLGEEKPPGEIAFEEPQQEGLPDWLVGAVGAGIGAAAVAASGKEPEQEVEQPPLETEEPVIAEFEEEFVGDVQVDAALETPDWLSELESAEAPEFETGSTAPAEKGELPEWLVGAAAVSAASILGQSDTAEDEGEQPEFFGEQELAQEAASELPDWMVSAPEMEQAGAASLEDLPDWMMAAPPSEGALEALGLSGEDISIEPALESSQLTEQVSEAPLLETPGDYPAEELPDWMIEEPVSEAELEAETSAEETGLPGWLIGAATGAALGAAALARDDEDETQAPEELQPAVEDAGAIEISSEQPDLLTPSEEISFEPQEVVTPEEEEAAFAWLEGLAAKQGASEALFLSPDERLDEPPDWIQKEAALAAGALILGGEGESQPLPEEEERGFEQIMAVDDLADEGMLPSEEAGISILPEQAGVDEGISAWTPEEFYPVEIGEDEISPLEGIPAETTPEEFLPDWLRAAGPESEVAQAEAEHREEGEIPAWLSQMELSDEEISETPRAVTESELSDEAMLDWLPEISEEVDLEGVLADEGEDQILSDWLSRMPAEGAGIGDELEQTQPSSLEETAAQASIVEPGTAIEESPPSEVEAAPTLEQVEGPEQTQPEEGEIPGWIAGAAAAALVFDREPAPEEELPLLEETAPAGEPELVSGIPEWLEEPEPGIEETPVGLSVDRLKIEEPAITPTDTQPSAAAALVAAALTAPTSFQEDVIESAPGEAAQLDTPAEVEREISDEDAAFAWLESLAVKQGATEALLLSPEERLEEPPEWVVEETMMAGDEELEEAVVPGAGPEAELAYGESEATFEVEDETTPQGEVEEYELPEWLIGASAAAGAAAAALWEGEEKQQGVEPEAQGEPESVELVLPETEPELEQPLPEEEMPELPDWLADLEPENIESVGEAEDLDWIPEMADVASISEAAAQEREITPLDINKASLIEIERLPGVGYRRAQALIEYRQQHGPLASIDQLSEVAGFDPEILEELSPYLQVASQGALTKADIDVDLLIQARAAIYQADIPTALQNYQSLIQQKQNLPEVVKDLEEALFSYPVDVSIWMALGDAQMRSGQLHKAMESYNKAEELLV